MRNLVIQYYIDIQKYTQPGYNNLKPSPIEEYSTHSFKQYCGKFDLDYCRITEPKINFKHPTWERFDLWTDPSWWDRYEQIMYVDSDVVALPDAPNVFELYKDLDTFKFARYNRYRKMPVEIHASSNRDTIFKDIDPAIIQKKRFQTGVFILTKKIAEAMLSTVKEYSKCKVDDGQFLNWAVMHSGVPYTEMDLKFNVKNNGQYIKDKISFMHCAGGKKHKKASKIWHLMKEYYPTVQVDLSVLQD
jgi:hypothetical protein